MATDERGSSTERGYGSRWRKARAAYLTKHPLCVMCEAQGRVTAATVVDHIVPHRGDSALFWDSANNWQALCAPCHNGHKQRMEKSGAVVGCDINGVPIDKHHHWNARGGG